MRQLTNPIQFVLALHHIAPSTGVATIGADSVCAFTQLGRKDVTRASMREAARQAGFRSGADLT